MSMRLRVPYLGTGLLAVAPMALGTMIAVTPDPETPPRMFGALAVVDLVGPIVHHEGSGLCSYDGLKRRIAGVFALAGVKAALVCGDTVGGDVHGMLDTARELRAMADACGKKLYWYVDSQTNSAGVALASAADRIFCPANGFYGSVGVLFAHRDETRADAMMGLRWHVVASGEHKTDSNAHVEMTEAALDEMRRHVDGAAAQFFQWVSERRGLPVEALASLNGRILQGPEALALGLVDQIATFDEAVAMLAAGFEGKAQAGTTGEPMDRKALIAALAALAEQGDEEAKKALAAFGEAGEDKSKAKAEGEAAPSESDDDKDKEKDKPAARAEGEAAPSDDDDKPKAKAGVDMQARAGLSDIQKRLDRQETSNLLSARADLPDAMRASLSGLPPATVAGILKSTPVYPKAPGPVAAARAALGTENAATATGAASTGGPSEDAGLNAMMGIVEDRPVVETTALGAVFRAAPPKRMAAAARELQARIEASKGTVAQ